MSDVSVFNLGVVAREFRELIKDVWYRNNAEKKEAELHLIRAKLEMMERFGLRFQDLDMLQRQMPRQMRLPLRAEELGAPSPVKGEKEKPA